METKFISRKGASFIGLAKGKIDLLQWVNVFIMHKKLKGVLDDLSMKWMGQPLPPYASPIRWCIKIRVAVNPALTIDEWRCAPSSER